MGAPSREAANTPGLADPTWPARLPPPPSILRVVHHQWSARDAPGRTLREQCAGIATGLTVRGGSTLRDAQAVKSNDFEEVYFISAEIDGSGLKGDGEIGTWAKSGPHRRRRGTDPAVDGFAKEFSDWGDGGTTDAELSMDDDGAEESKDCVGG